MCVCVCVCVSRLRRGDELLSHELCEEVIVDDDRNTAPYTPRNGNDHKLMREGERPRVPGTPGAIGTLLYRGPRLKTGMWQNCKRTRACSNKH